MRKKALATLLACSMLVSNELGANVASAASSSTAITVNSIANTTTVANYVTVDFDNSVSGWKDVYAYVWNNAGDAKVFSAAYESGNHVIFNITGSYKNVIFKNKENGWDQQTADLSLPKYTESADDKCFKPYSAGNKSQGTWGKSVAIYNRKSILPSVSADKTTVAAGDTVTFTMKAEYENGHYLNSRSLNFVYEDGTTESLRSFDTPSYANMFTKVAENTYTYTWKPSKAGKVKVIYNVNQYEDHGEDSQAITLNVKGQVATATPTVTPTVTPAPINQSYVTVDFDNSVSGWKNVYAYVWGNTSDAKVFTPAYVSGNHVIFNITGSYKYVIFKNKENGWDQQTADLSLPKYTESADDKCFKPYSAGNKSQGTWGKSNTIGDRKTVLPSVSADKNTVAAGDKVTFTMKSEFEGREYLNRRSLTFKYEDGTTETIESASSPSYGLTFTRTAENTYVYTWTPSKTGKVKVIYNINVFEDHGEDSQAITLNVNGQVATATPTITPTVTPTPINQSYVTVDFDNSVSNWKNVYAYVWNNGGDSKVFSTAYVSGNHFIFNITGSYKNIIFKNQENGWDRQTADLSLPKYTESADDKCFKPYSAGNKSQGTWGRSAAIYNRKAILPSVSADKATVAVGNAVTFTMKAEYENGHYLNSRSLNFVYEDGTTECLRSFDTPSYANMFTKVAENTYTYTWKPSKAGKVKVIYNVNQYEDHGEDSQAITLNVKAK